MCPCRTRLPLNVLSQALLTEVSFIFCLLDGADPGYNGDSSGPAGV